ncbi:MAG: PfkB family carbohydrate kinase [Bacteroidota bacterium]
MLCLSPPSQLRLTQATSFDAILTGGECNVSIALADLGLPTAFITRIPDQERGWSARDYIRKFGVDTSHIVSFEK